MKITRATFIIIFAALSLWVIGNLHVIGKRNFEYIISSENYHYVINATVTDRAGKEKNYTLYARHANFGEAKFSFSDIIGQGFFGPKYYNKIKITVLEIESKSLDRPQMAAFKIKLKAP